MTDTAQSPATAENAMDDAASAFKSFLNPEPAQLRDDEGRFASQSEPEAETEEEIENEVPVDDGDDDAQEVDEAADEAQPDAADMPSSWSKDDEELWNSLTPEAQAKIAEREAQRDAGLNQKLQEAANVRKLVEQQAAEANANRDAYAQAIDQVIGLINYPKPDPTQFGLGTGEYDRESYDLAIYQWEQTQGELQSLAQQRQAIAAQQEYETSQARLIAQQEVEQIAWPKFVADVPELQDAAKGKQVINELIEYAANAGIPKESFTVDGVTSREMHLLWKAQQYDRIKAAETRVKAKNPPPKPAAPAVKPGGITPRSTIQANRMGKAQARLAKEGSIEAGADVFKNFFRS